MDTCKGRSEELQDTNSESWKLWCNLVVNWLSCGLSIPFFESQNLPWTLRRSPHCRCNPQGWGSRVSTSKPWRPVPSACRGRTHSGRLNWRLLKIRIFFFCQIFWDLTLIRTWSQCYEKKLDLHSHAKIKHSDWLKEVTWLRTSNQIA